MQVIWIHVLSTQHKLKWKFGSYPIYVILDNSGLKVDLTLVNKMPKYKDALDDILKLFYALHNLLILLWEKKIFKKQKIAPFLISDPHAYKDMPIKIN